MQINNKAKIALTLTKKKIKQLSLKLANKSKRLTILTK